MFSIVLVNVLIIECNHCHAHHVVYAPAIVSIEVHRIARCCDGTAYAVPQQCPRNLIGKTMLQNLHLNEVPSPEQRSYFSKQQAAVGLDGSSARHV